MDWLFSCEADQSLRFIEQTIEDAGEKIAMDLWRKRKRQNSTVNFYMPSSHCCHHYHYHHLHYYCHCHEDDHYDNVSCDSMAEVECSEL